MENTGGGPKAPENDPFCVFLWLNGPTSCLEIRVELYFLTQLSKLPPLALQLLVWNAALDHWESLTRLTRWMFWCWHTCGWTGKNSNRKSHWIVLTLTWMNPPRRTIQNNQEKMMLRGRKLPELTFYPLTSGSNCIVSTLIACGRRLMFVWRWPLNVCLLVSVTNLFSVSSQCLFF